MDRAYRYFMRMLMHWHKFMERKKTPKKTSFANADIVICAPLFLGDMMMLAPIISVLKIEALKRRRRVAMICRSELQSVADIFGLDHVFPVAKPTWKVVGQIEMWKNDEVEIYCVFAPQWIPFLSPYESGVKIISFPDPKGTWDFLIDKKVELRASPIFAPEIPLDLLENRVSISKSEIPFDVWQSEGNYVVVHVGARVATKRFQLSQLEAIINVLSGLGLDIYVTAGPDEYDRLAPEKIEIPDKHKKNVRWNLGDMTLDQLPGLLVKSRLVLGMDTGITHLAKHMGVPTIVFLGPSQSELYGGDNLFSRSRHLSATVLPCQDKKTYHGHRRKWIANCYRRECIFPNQKCLVFEEDIFLEVVNDFLELSR